MGQQGQTGRWSTFQMAGYFGQGLLVKKSRFGTWIHLGIKEASRITDLTVTGEFSIMPMAKFYGVIRKRQRRNDASLPNSII